MVESARMRLLAFVMLASALTAARQAPAPAVSEGGQRVFEQFCSKCHGADGRGGERGPNIIKRLAFRNDNELAALIRDGLPSAGMPGMALPAATSRSLIKFVRRLQSQEGADRPRVTLQTTDGATIDGIALNRGDDDLQVLTDDGKVRLLRKSDNAPPHGDLGCGLAHLPRTAERQPVQRARSNHRDQRCLIWRRHGCSAGRQLAARGDAGGRGRHHVHHVRQRMLRARCRQRAARSGTSSGRARKASPATPPAASTAALPSPAIACSW